MGINSKWWNHIWRLSNISGFWSSTGKRRILELQRCWRHEFETEPLTCVTTSRFGNKFEGDGTVKDVLKGLARETSHINWCSKCCHCVVSLNVFAKRVTKPVYTGFWKLLSQSRTYWLVQALSEDNPYRGVEFCEFFFFNIRMLYDNEFFPDLMVWSDEATFKHYGTVNRHNWLKQHIQ